MKVEGWVLPVWAPISTEDVGADPRVYAECQSLKPSGLMHLYEQIRDVNVAMQD